MEILFNCTTNLIGGGLKNSKLFIDRIIKGKGNQYNWHVAMPRSYLKWFPLEHFPSSMNVLVLDKSPARSFEARKLLKDFQAQHCFELVYTMAGPAYVDFTCNHIMGLSNPYLYLAGRFEFSFGLGRFGWLKRLLQVSYQRLHSTKADGFLFQTEASLKAFCMATGVASDTCRVVPNAIDNSGLLVPGRAEGEDVVLFCPSPGYSHKGHILLPPLSLELSSALNHKLVLLLDDESKIGQEVMAEAQRLGVEDNFLFLGAVEYRRMGQLYQEAHAVLVPTVLETFTATFYEAFQVEKPLVVFNLPFAEEVCGTAAKYVNYLDPVDAAKGILEILQDDSRRMEMILDGRKRVSAALDQDARFELILDCISEMCYPRDS